VNSLFSFMLAFVVWLLCIALCFWMLGGIGLLIGHIAGVVAAGFIGYYTSKYEALS
jgi:hypothetical protein